MGIYYKKSSKSELHNLVIETRNSQNEGAEEGDNEAGFATITEKPKLKQPPLYKVVLINDDYTPMDFVVDVLRAFFDLNAEKATQMALDAIQILGGNGYINDFACGRLLRDAKLYEIGAGTSEVRRMLIGREIFNESK